MTAGRPLGRRLRAAATDVLPFLLLAVALTWPLPKHFATALPHGTEQEATVPLFNLWTVWWNADRAAHGFAGYWQAPIFHPTPDTFAYSEAQPTTVVVAPLVWLCRLLGLRLLGLNGGSPIPAYNAYVLLALTLNGWSGYRLFRALGLRRGVSYCGGALVESLPFIHWQFGVLQLVPLFGIVWTFHALYRFNAHPGARRGIVLGLAFAATYLLCNYYGLFLSVLLPPAAVCLLGTRLLRWRTWLGLAVGGVVAGACLLPVVAVQWRLSHTHDWKRPDVKLLQLSAEPRDYTVPAWSRPARYAEFGPPFRRRYWRLGGGQFKTMLALAGCVLLVLFRRRLRGWALCCGSVLLLAFLLSQGLKLQFGTVVPYRWLIAAVPGFAQARNVFRFAVFVQLMIVFLAVPALGMMTSPALWRRLWRRWRGRRSTDGRRQNETDAAAGSRRHGRRGWIWAGRGLMIAAGLFALIETWPARQRLIAPQPSARHAAWTGWLRDNTDPAAVVACLPFPADATTAAYQPTTLWMYWQTFHHRRLVNGYSGYFPEEFLNLRRALRSFPDERSLAALREAGVSYCVMRHSDLPAQFTGGTGLPDGLKEAFDDPVAEIRIYDIRVLEEDRQSPAPR